MKRILPLLFMLFVGCRDLYGWHAVSFKVKDAETGAPIGGAAITANYCCWDGCRRPAVLEDKTVVADEQGVYEGRMPTVNHRLNVSAEGYIYSFTGYTNEDERSRTLEFELYKLPKPTVQVVVSEAYVGVLVVRFHEKEGLAGQREFKTTADGRGVASLDIPSNHLLADWRYRGSVESGDQRNVEFLSAETGKPIRSNIHEYYKSPQGQIFFMGDPAAFEKWKTELNQLDSWERGLMIQRMIEGEKPAEQ